MAKNLVSVKDGDEWREIGTSTAGFHRSNGERHNEAERLTRWLREIGTITFEGTIIPLTPSAERHKRTLQWIYALNALRRFGLN